MRPCISYSAHTFQANERDKRVCYFAIHIACSVFNPFLASWLLGTRPEQRFSDRTLHNVDSNVHSRGIHTHPYDTESGVLFRGGTHRGPCHLKLGYKTYYGPAAVQQPSTLTYILYSRMISKSFFFVFCAVAVAALTKPNFTPNHSVLQKRLAGQSVAFACYGGGGDCQCPIDLTGDSGGVLMNVYPGFQCAYADGACTWDDKVSDNCICPS